MAAGMNALVGINSQLQDLQAQALSGKKINSAADGLSSYLSATTYMDRANRLTSINSTLSQNLGTIKAASTGLSSISKTVNDALDQLKTVSQTQAQVAGTGGYATVSGDTTTQGKMIFTQTNAAGQALAVNNGTALAGGVNRVFIGGQLLAQGNTFSFAVNGAVKNIRIAGPAATDPNAGTQDGSATNPIYVRTIQDLMNTMSGFNAATATATSQSYLGVTGANTNANTYQVNLQLNATVSTADNSNNGSFQLASTSASGVDVAQMLVAVRPAGANGTTYSYDTQTNGGTAGSVGQSSTLSGSKSTWTQGTGAVAADTKRAAAAASYKLALTAIDQYLKDASVSGINLLNGDSLLATFNEKGTNNTIQLTTTAGAAASYGSTGLGLVNAVGAQDYANNFAVNVDTADANGNPLTGLQAAINKLTAAQTTIQLGVAQVGQFQNTIQNRSDFNMSIISLLNDSANNLTAADMTQVSTQTAALQVQQSFAQAILSATKQSDQSMLQLLR